MVVHLLTSHHWCIAFAGNVHPARDAAVLCNRISSRTKEMKHCCRQVKFEAQIALHSVLSWKHMASKRRDLMLDQGEHGWCAVLLVDKRNGGAGWTAAKVLVPDLPQWQSAACHEDIRDCAIGIVAPFVIGLWDLIEPHTINYGGDHFCA